MEVKSEVGARSAKMAKSPSRQFAPGAREILITYNIPKRCPPHFVGRLGGLAGVIVVLKPPTTFEVHRTLPSRLGNLDPLFFIPDVQFDGREGAADGTGFAEPVGGGDEAETVSFGSTVVFVHLTEREASIASETRDASGRARLRRGRGASQARDARRVAIERCREPNPTSSRTIPNRSNYDPKYPTESKPKTISIHTTILSTRKSTHNRSPPINHRLLHRNRARRRRVEDSFERGDVVLFALGFGEFEHADEVRGLEEGAASGAKRERAMWDGSEARDDKLVTKSTCNQFPSPLLSRRSRKTGRSSKGSPLRGAD